MVQSKFADFSVNKKYVIYLANQANRYITAVITIKFSVLKIYDRACLSTTPPPPPGILLFTKAKIANYLKSIVNPCEEYILYFWNFTRQALSKN